MPTSSFSWLHLTDLHYDLKGQGHLWPTLREPFLESLGPLRERCGPWDAVLFTGDLVQSGESAQFERMQAEFLDPLWKRLSELGSGDAVLLAVPGNHDLYRRKPEEEDNAALDTLLNKDGFLRIQEKFWDRPAGPYRRVIRDAFAAYSQWWEKAPHRPGDVKTGILPGDFSVSLGRVGIVGLNTTFLQLAGGDYKGRLVWDARQLHAVCEGGVDVWSKQHDFCLLLTHQGPDWQTPEARKQGESEIAPTGRFVVHLFGHQHETVIAYIRRGGSAKATRLSQGCSVFGMEKFGEPPTIQRAHGYAAGRIEFGDGEALLRFWPRIATNKTGPWRFIPDHEHTELESDEGTAPETVAARSRAVGATLAILPAQRPFFGRTKDLELIAKYLLPEDRSWGVVLNGPGGVGKTALALEAAHRAPAEHFPLKLWITAKNRELLPEGEHQPNDRHVSDYHAMLNELGRALGRDDISVAVPEERPNLVRNALATHRALLVLDNLETFSSEDRRHVFELLDSLPANCRAVVTSRRRPGGSTAGHNLRLDKLERESVDELLAELGRRWAPAARLTQVERDQLYAETGGNPLLLTWTVGQLGRATGNCRTVAEAIERLQEAYKENDPLDFVLGELVGTFTADETAVLAALVHFTEPAPTVRLLPLTRLSLKAMETALEGLRDRALLIEDDQAATWLLPPLTARFLRRSLPKAVGVSGERLGEGTDLGRADKEELIARNELGQFAYDSARHHVEAAMSLDSRRTDRLREEFGFLFALGELTTDRRRWCTEVWRILSHRNSFALLEAEAEDLTLGSADKTAGEQLIELKRALINEHISTPEQKGEELENGVARLFRSFFRLGDDFHLRVRKIRKQNRGSQGGFDLSIEWSGECEAATDQLVRCHVECKNYRDPIRPAQVAEKLLSEPMRNPTIDHWILISPRANPSNELNRFLEHQDNEGTFPFQVQVWCPETGIAELFGLEPSVYDYFFSVPEGESHPRTWDQVRKETVLAHWRSRLAPFLRLPRGWSEYVRDPALLCLHKEVPQEMERAYKGFVPMRARNTAGVLLERPLEAYVDEWLEEPDKPVLFLLGEFGDGKSFFTYVQARRLIARWISDRTIGWLPLRLALNKYTGNARDFLRQRLEEFNANVGGWGELGKESRRLIMLDGFDEMSAALDPATVTKNIKALLDCIHEFDGCKLMITSRTHFFENRRDAQRLLNRLGQPPILRLAPLSRSEVLRHLAHEMSNESARPQLLQSIQSMNDPVGLASKPLFLEMLKEVLRSPDLPEDLDVVSLYERYIVQSLRRKSELLDDPDLQAHPQETADNLHSILGEIAEELQRTGQPFIDLSRFQSVARKPFAELLWKLSGEEGLNEDAKNRVGARSLLARVAGPDIDEEWPVDFCHRSMREYFVSVRLCEAVEQGEEMGAKFLQEVPLNNEILEFSAERWRKSRSSISDKLLALIRRAEPGQRPGRLGGYALTLLHRVEPRLPSEFDWRGKVYDGADLEEANFAGMNFSSSSFRNANLANANFEDADFRQCDLTGVRIEETAYVVSASFDPSGEYLIAAYADNLLRQWVIRSSRKTISKVVGNVNIEPSSAIGIHESGQLWMQAGREWIFFDLQEDQTWKPSTRFAIKDAIVEARPQGRLMTFVERISEGSLQISNVELSTQAKLCSVSAKAARHCMFLGTDAVAYSDAGVEVCVRSLSLQGQPSKLTFQYKEASCTDVVSIAPAQYLLAVGTSGGHVYVWKLDLRTHEWSQRKICDLAAHDGPVTSVAFQGTTTLASTSSDRSIALITLNEISSDSATIERRLLLRLRCKGMKIEGLRTETERALLAKLSEEGQ